MIQIIAKTAILTAVPAVIAQIPKWIDDLVTYFTEDDVSPVDNTKKPKVFNKRKDMSKFTQEQFDHIQMCFLKYYHNNPKVTYEDMAVMLNKDFGLNKEKKAYAKIWRNEVDRDSLEPCGKKENS